MRSKVEKEMETRVKFTIIVFIFKLVPSRFRPPRSTLFPSWAAGRLGRLGGGRGAVGLGPLPILFGPLAPATEILYFELEGNVGLG